MNNLQKALDIWWWIDGLQDKYVNPPDRYDKQLLKKCESIQELLKNTDWGRTECCLVDSITKRLDENRSKYRTYDLVKAVIHNEILRKNHIEPLREEKIIQELPTKVEVEHD